MPMAIREPLSGAANRRPISVEHDAAIRWRTFDLAETISEAVAGGRTTHDIPIAICYATRLLRAPGLRNAQHGEREQHAKGTLPGRHGANLSRPAACRCS